MSVNGSVNGSENGSVNEEQEINDDVIDFMETEFSDVFEENDINDMFNKIKNEFCLLTNQQILEYILSYYLNYGNVSISTKIILYLKSFNFDFNSKTNSLYEGDEKNNYLLHHICEYRLFDLIKELDNNDIHLNLNITEYMGDIKYNAVEHLFVGHHHGDTETDFSDFLQYLYDRGVPHVNTQFLIDFVGKDYMHHIHDNVKKIM